LEYLVEILGQSSHTNANVEKYNWQIAHCFAFLMKSLEEIEQAAYDLIRYPAIKDGEIFVTLSYAQSLDGYIAKQGQRTAISCQESLILTHAIRASRDALLIGVQTCLIDNPSLTARRVSRGPTNESPRNPIAVVIDTNLNLLPSSKFIENCIILCSLEASDESKELLTQRGARIYRIPRESSTNRLDLIAGLKVLYSLGIRSVMVEGGAKIIQEFIRIGRVDELIVTVAPMILGSGTPSTVDSNEMKLVTPTWHTFGRDVVLYATTQ
jgi:2,5-diamino-6-(ribosylamino)-4(3H)-pyrimidinone 5'-phosphate reductase